MTLSFDPQARALRVVATVWGPNGPGAARLAVDTGASWTTLDPAFLSALGYVIPEGEDATTIYTANGAVRAARIELVRVAALDCSAERLLVVCQSFPPGARIDGLLGLDFFRGRRLIIDFRRGEMTLD